VTHNGHGHGHGLGGVAAVSGGGASVSGNGGHRVVGGAGSPNELDRNLRISLDDRELWLRFQNLTNEMIVTKNGRWVSRIDWIVCFFLFYFFVSAVRNSNVLNGDGGAFCFPMQIGNGVLRFCFWCIAFPRFSSHCSPFASHNEALTFLQLSLEPIHSKKTKSMYYNW